MAPKYVPVSPYRIMARNTDTEKELTELASYTTLVETEKAMRRLRDNEAVALEAFAYDGNEICYHSCMSTKRTNQIIAQYR